MFSEDLLCSISKDGALQPSFGTNLYMSLLEFSATADVGVSVLSVDSSSLFHSSCNRTASLKSSNSDGGTTGGNGKLQLAVVLRLGLIPFSLGCGTVILISCSRTASLFAPTKG